MSKIIGGCLVENHVGTHNDVLTEAKEAVNVGLAVFVVAIVEVGHETTAHQVQFEHGLFEFERANFLVGFQHESTLAPQKVGEEKIDQTRDAENDETDLVNVEIL